MNALLANYDECQRADQMKVVAYMAGVDGNVSSEEIYLLRELCQQFVLGPHARGEVMRATVMDREEMVGTLGRLATAGLKFGLLLDICTIARADGTLHETEEHEIRELARILKVAAPQLEALLQFSQTLHGILTTKPEEAQKSVGEALKVIEPLVPASALAMSAVLWMVRGSRQ